MLTHVVKTTSFDLSNHNKFKADEMMLFLSQEVPKWTFEMRVKGSLPDLCT